MTTAEKETPRGSDPRRPARSVALCATPHPETGANCGGFNHDRCNPPAETHRIEWDDGEHVTLYCDSDEEAEAQEAAMDLGDERHAMTCRCAACGEGGGAAPERITFPSINPEDAMPVNWLWNHWIPRGFVTILSAPGGTGKGSIALEIALAAAGAIDTFPDGSPASPAGGGVLYVSFEDELKVVLNARAHAFGAGPTDAIKVAGGREVSAAMERSGGKDPLAVLDEMRGSDARPPALLVIDPLVEMVGVLGLSENDNGEMASLMAAIRKYAEQWKCAVLIAHHTRKGSAVGAAAEASRGASAISNAARVQLRLLNGPPEDMDARMLGRAKSNLGPTGGIVKYRLYVHEFYNEHGDLIDTAILVRDGYDKESNIGLELAKGADGTAADAPMQRRDALLKYIGEYGPVAGGDLYTVFQEVTERQMGAAIKRLREQGDIESREITKALAATMGRPYTKGEHVHRVRSEEPW